MTTPARIRLSRAKGWRKPEGAVVVARPSKWGNPWRVGQHRQSGRWYVEGPGLVVCQYCGNEEGARLVAVRYFREHHVASLDLSALRGRSLCCWCPLDAPCHGDILLELANR